MLPLSESFSNLCLCFQTYASAVSQQVQSASVSVNGDQVNMQCNAVQGVQVVN